jgi:hypothetical protein
VCFSPEADVVAGVVIGALAVDALRSRPARRDVPLALLPAVLATHSLIEAFVWWAGRGQIAEGWGTVATYAYVLIAYALLPTLLPAAVLAREVEPMRRRALGVLLAIGLTVSAVMVHAIVNGPLTATLEHHYIRYGAGVPSATLVVGAYVVVTCGAGLLSSSRTVVWFSVANVLVVALLAWLMTQALTSLWCGWAAVTSLAIVLMLRRTSRARHRTPVA